MPESHKPTRVLQKRTMYVFYVVLFLVASQVTCDSASWSSFPELPVETTLDKYQVEKRQPLPALRVCSVEELDEPASCAGYQLFGFCDLSFDVVPFMRECNLTCGICQPPTPPPPTTPPPPPVCTPEELDEPASCAGYKLFGFCDLSFDAVPFMRACNLTCGICQVPPTTLPPTTTPPPPPPTTTPPPPPPTTTSPPLPQTTTPPPPPPLPVCTPEELDEPLSCPGYKAFGWCDSNDMIIIAFMRANCNLTCGICERFNCDRSPCMNGGTCLELDNRSFCLCPSGFTGVTCEGVVPSISQHPQDSAGLEGDEVTLCCEAGGAPSPTYQWFYEGAPLQESSSNLRLSSLSSNDSGSYRCRATNDFGSIFSSVANLNVIPGSGNDSCDPTPTTNVVDLPPGCSEDSSGSNGVNVGTCSYEPCVKRGEAGSCGGQESIRKCCSPAAMSDSAVSCDNGMKFTIQKVTHCACANCSVPEIIVRGRAVDRDGNPLQNGEITLGDEEGNFSTDMSGNFRIPVKSGTQRLVLTFKDTLQGLLMDTTKAFTLNEGQVSFYTIVLQTKPPVMVFSANEEQKIPLNGSDGKPSFVDIEIPSNAFVTADGAIYDGNITASIGVIDPRSEADMAAAPGDFSAIDENGEEVMLGTAGILRLAFTDDNGRQLNLAKNITVRLDAEQLDIPPGVTVVQWYLDDKTGRWVKFGELRLEEGVGVLGLKRQVRRFFVGIIIPGIPWDRINWDYVATASYVRVRAPAGTVVTRIGLTDNGQQFTSYRQETVPASGILCILSLRDKLAILRAELNEAPLIPQQPINFPAAVNPQVIVQSFQFNSTKVNDSGPVYLLFERGRCTQNRASDLAFEFEEANAGQLFHWESPRINDPNDPRFWNVRPGEICFIKAVVNGSNPDSIIYVNSTGKAPSQPDVDYGFTAEEAAMVGSAGVVCLEYRCNEGPQSAYETHLQVLTLTGTCTSITLNSVLDGQQGQCPVPPDNSSSAERNFCVPSNLVGGDAGLYTGDTAVAKSRCLTGNNQYNSGPVIATTTNPTVTFYCRNTSRPTTQPTPPTTPTPSPPLPTTTTPLTGSVNITLVVFSGVPDPQWRVNLSDFNASDYQAIQNKSLSPDCIPAKLGYKGFLVRDAGSELLIVGLDDALIDHLQQVLLGTMPDGLIPSEVRQRVSDEIGNVSPAAHCFLTRRKRLAPAFSPGPWNTNSNTRRNNNCYNWANIKVTNTYAQPGRGSGQIFNPLNGTAVRDAAIRDGLLVLTPHPEPADPVPGPPAGLRLLVALFVDPGIDFHWYLLNQGGLWSHKPGQTGVIQTDEEGNNITDPRQADTLSGFWNYTFVAFMTSDFTTVTIA